MGVHTWIYKKISNSDEDHVKSFLDQCNSQLKGFKKDFKTYSADRKRIGAEYRDSYPVGSDSYAMWDEYISDKVIAREYKKLVKTYSKFTEITLDNIFDFCKTYMVKDSADFRIYKNTLYIQYSIDWPFRSGTYTDKTFVDKKKLVNWLKKNSATNLSYQYNGKEENTFSDSFIEVINNFYTKEGEDTLFVEFG